MLAWSPTRSGGSLCRQLDQFKCRLAAIWGTDEFQYTAVPLDLIASNLLDHSAELPIDRKAATLYWAGSVSQRFLPTPGPETGQINCPDHSPITESAQNVGFQANPKWTGILTITEEKWRCSSMFVCGWLMGSWGRLFGKAQFGATRRTHTFK